MRSRYDHRRHAGNHGDVFKHVALLSFLDAVRPRRVIETHAGRGAYTLAPDGAWTGGLGRLLAAFPAPASAGAVAVDRYLARVRPYAARGLLPGSPRLALDVLRTDGRLVLHELDPDAADALATSLADPRVRVVAGDGWAVVPQADAALVIDPPFDAADDWDRAAAAVVPGAMLWYPIDGTGRADALHERLRARGVAFVALELGVAPPGAAGLTGSGVILAGAPAGVVAEVEAALPVLARALARDGGRGATSRRVDG